MNKQINFDDIIYILNVRIRMIKDLFRLDINMDLFYSQTVVDLEFISSLMDTLTEKFLKNHNFVDYETAAENILDAEWQFNQLLIEISNNSGENPFTRIPEAQTLITRFKKESANRKKQIEESCTSTENSAAEPVVTYTELNSLLGSV